MASHSHYSSSETDAISFIFIILLLCTVWQHKTGLLQVEHIAKYVLLVVVLVISLFWLFKLKNKFWRDLSSTLCRETSGQSKSFSSYFCSCIWRNKSGGS